MPTSQVEGRAAVSNEPRSAFSTFLMIAIPNATAFFSSMCIMVVELVAGRMIARHVGNSLYTWTSVIGVVLAGIAVGNWVGGRLADRFHVRNALAAVFSVASIACFTIPVLNRAAGDWSFLLRQEWPVRIACHVCMVFFLPSAVLGCISPMAAKMALDLGRETGRTVGSVYAWGAVGSILGTFLTGFVLISKMGTVAVVVSAGLAMALVAVVYGASSLFPYLWAATALCLVIGAMGPWRFSQQLALETAFRRERFANVLYVDESQYSYIQIEEEADPPNTRSMSLDHLVHSYIVMNDPANLQYDYEKLYASITKTALEDKPRPSAFFIGGGGYVFPRYLLAKWPASYIEVAEIDPRVTEAAYRAFALSRALPLHIYNLDARNHVDDLLRRKAHGEQVPSFDLIYGDAFNHYSVPYHLTTLEFNLKLRQLMSPDGVYVINVIDVYKSGKFLGAVLNTFAKSFPHVYAFSTETAGPSSELDRRDTFVVVGSLQPLRGTGLEKDVPGSALTPKNFEELRQRSRNIVLTDDYAPVEQLLEPVVRLADKES
ncbi:MAG TPA: fused MFS/spermidine synthase [Bryobacterales bacterium]|nr:fused MFS/spermidine synthase [Bryobacterales bacterium]